MVQFFAKYYIKHFQISKKIAKSGHTVHRRRASKRQLDEK